MTFLSPLRGLGWWDIVPTACAVGCILAPLRGLLTADATACAVGCILTPLRGLLTAAATACATGCIFILLRGNGPALLFGDW